MDTLRNGSLLSCYDPFVYSLFSACCRIILGGKYNKDTKFADGRAKNPLFQGEAFARNLEKVSAVFSSRNAESGN